MPTAAPTAVPTAVSNALPPYRAVIQSDWIDYNGHLRDAFYGLIASHAIDDFMDRVGLDAGYRQRTQCTLYTLEMHLHYLHEVKSTDDVDVHISVLDADRKRIHVGCRFSCPRVSDDVATADVMLLHVQQGEKPTSSAFPDDVEARLQSLRLPTEAAAAWGPASRKIEIKRR